MIGDRRLPERIARQFVSVAKIAPKEVERAAKALAEMDEREREEEATEIIQDLLAEHSCWLSGGGGCYWPPDWKPEEEEGATTCQACSMRLAAQGRNYCAEPKHFEDRARRWQNHELQRLSVELGIEIGQADEAKPLKIEYHDIEVVKMVLKRKTKPDCLRLMAAPSHEWQWHYHFNILGSEVVVLGSTDASVLNRERDRMARAQEVDVSSDEQAGAGHDIEEAEREARRDKHSAERRAQYDIPWLIFSVASACADQLEVGGTALHWMMELVLDASRVPHAWPQFEQEYDRLQVVVDEAKGKARESLMRRMMLVNRLSSAIYSFDPHQQYDWVRALESVRTIAEELDLKLPTKWDCPPVWSTETNCHVCGRFTSMGRITKRDEQEGWKVEGKVVTCSDECRARLRPAKVGRKTKVKAKKI